MVAVITVSISSGVLLSTQATGAILDFLGL